MLKSATRAPAKKLTHEELDLQLETANQFVGDMLHMLDNDDLKIRFVSKKMIFGKGSLTPIGAFADLCRTTSTSVEVMCLWAKIEF